MQKNYEEFFLGLKEPNFLVMKLLYELFQKFESDELSRRIVDNISVLSQYDIRLLYGEDSSNYVYSKDDLSRIDYAITTCGSKQIACHEFGHLLLDLFARGEVPEEFSEVNEECKKRLTDNKEGISCLLRQYCDETFKKLMVDITNPLGFYNRHPELRDEYFKKHPESSEDDLVEDILIDHFNLISSFDRNIDNCNRVANIIDAIFCGNNPFFLEYGNEHIDPVLAMHHDEYFETGDYGPLVMGFEEQFADYLVLRTYPEEMKEARCVLREILGDEWFSMMDNFYDKVTSRVCEKGKVYQYK